jgi:hypothetical protein
MQRGNGYIREYNPFHPRSDRRGMVSQHRLVVERHLGRILPPENVVHHVNGVKSDNRIENLEVFESQSEHLSHEHKTARNTPCYNPDVIAQVRRMAEDPSVTVDSLDISPTTVVKICRMYDIEWKHGLQITEDQVKQALSGRMTHDAAVLLACSVQTLHNRFGHLLTKRKSPGFLQPHIQDVLRKAIEYGINETARQFDTSRNTVTKALKKAGLWDEYQDATAGIRGGRRENTQLP